jgi:hypothetical protein
MVEDVNYTMITDVQIAERTKTQVQTDNVAVLRQGTSGAKVQTSTETGNQHKYQTRVVSNANKVNLKFLKPSLFLKTSWQNRSLIFCKLSIPARSRPYGPYSSGVSELFVK